MSRASALAVAALAVALPVHAAEQPQAAPEAKAPVEETMAKTKPGGDTSPIPQDEKVVITVRDGRLVAKPRFALIRKHQPLQWSVEGLTAGMTVEIDFEVYDGRKGPFPWRRGKENNPVRGRYLLDARTNVIEAAASDAGGYFKYHVVLRKGGEDVFALDPGVVVRNDN